MSQGEGNRKTLNRLKIAGGLLALFAVVGFIGWFATCDCWKSGSVVYSGSVSEFSKTDPNLINYQELRRVQLDLASPAAITIGADGRLYVSGVNAIATYDRLNGARLGGFKLAGTPRALACGPDGSIYAAMGEHVEVYDTSGSLKSRWGSLGSRAVITSIAATETEVWVADAGDRVAIKYDPSGQVLALFAKKDPAKNAPGIVLPSPHMDVAPANGGVWISNPGRWELEFYSADGTMAKSWGKASFAMEGFSPCCNPTDFAILPDGRFVTSEKGVPRVKTYSPDGKFEGVVAAKETFKPDVVGLDLAVDTQGHVFVLDPASKCVRVYVAKGKAK